MTLLIAFGAIASIVSLFTCPGAGARAGMVGKDGPRTPLPGMADQLGGNTLWHPAALPGASPGAFGRNASAKPESRDD